MEVSTRYPTMWVINEGGNNGELDPNLFYEPSSVNDQALVLFVFEIEIERFVSTPLESTVLHVFYRNHIGLANVFTATYRLSGDHGQYLSTKLKLEKFIKLKANKTLLQVQW